MPYPISAKSRCGIIGGLVLGCTLLAGCGFFFRQETLRSTQILDLQSQDVHDFVTEYLNEVQVLSIAGGVEYCGLVGYDINDNLAITPPQAGLEDSCQPDIEPEGFAVLASYHTHGAYSIEADSEVPSVDDLLADIDEQSYGYIATPGGRVWFVDWRQKHARILCDLGCVERDPDFQECEAFPPASEYTVKTLRQRFREDTGEC